MVTLSSITPTSGDNNLEITLNILGSGFLAPVTATLGGVALTDITLVNSSYFTGTLGIQVLDPGRYDLVVTNGDSNEATLTSVYRVTLPLPAPPFANETYNQIITRLLANSPGTWDKREGSIFRDFMNAVALDLEQIWSSMNYMLQLMFVQTSSEGYLDLIGQQYGVVRNTAVQAIGEVTFTGTNGTTIPLGTRLSTTVDINTQVSPIFFETTAVATISSGTADVAIRAVDGGVAGNVIGDTINRLVSGISGITSVTNDSATTGGSDIEIDETFRERLLYSINNPDGGGNKADYERWALEVDGVGQALCIPLDDGPGTVTVIIVDSDNGIPDAGLISDVQDYISPTPGTGEGKAPIGADVTVAAPTTVDIDVVVNITEVSGYVEADVIDDVEEALIYYINHLDIGEDVRYTNIANVVHDVIGVLDYTGLTVNAGTANVAIADTEKAVADTITVT